MTELRFAFGGPGVHTFNRPEVKPRLLVSYFYYPLFERVRESLTFEDYVLDSGAFSAKNSGAAIDLDEYIEFCLNQQKIDPQLTEIYALDVIGDHEKSLENTEKMWKAGVKAIPCYHLGEPFEALDHIAQRYDKIAIGGVARLRGKQKLAWIEYCFSRVWPKKIHGFACVDLQVLKAVPFHSVDATNWIAPEKYGQTYHMKRGTNVKLPKGSKHHLQIEVDFYMDLEKKLAHRWAKELALLEKP